MVYGAAVLFFFVPSLGARHSGHPAASTKLPSLIFCCSADNDLYKAVMHAGPPAHLQRVSNCTEAIRVGAATHGAVLLLSNGRFNDPSSLPTITPYIMQSLHNNNFRVFAELATIQPSLHDSMAGSALASMDSLAPCPRFARFVAAPGSPLWPPPPPSPAAAAAAGTHTDVTLQPLEVLEPNECKYMPYMPVSSGGGSGGGTAGGAGGGGGGGLVQHAALVKVAGFNSAVFGYNASDAPVPLLFQHRSHPGLMLSALRLSNVVSGRYSPTPAWSRLWRRLLRWLQYADGDDVWTDAVTFVPAVKPAYAPTATLPPTAMLAAVNAGITWLHTTSGLLVPSPAVAASTGILLDGTNPATCDGWPIASLPLPGARTSAAAAAAAVGSSGIFEAYLSGIDATGAQELGMNIRTDCVAESAGALALGAWGKFADGKAAAASAGLLDYLFYTSSAQAGPLRGSAVDPRTSALAGILLWGTNVPAPHATSLYSDDQYRALLSAAFAASALNTSKYNIPIARLLLGNVRLTGPLGYTAWLGDQESLAMANGWKHYWYAAEPAASEIQFYQAAARAGNLWGYKISGNQTLFLDRTLRGLNSSMAAFYEKRWATQVGMTSALSRMLLPLAWLVRVHDTPETRGWLRDVAELLLTYITPSGALQEDPFGFDGASSAHHPPTSNAGYGTAESTLAQNASDPVCDLLYSFNFALLGMHEAAAATAAPAHAAPSRDHTVYAEAAAKMADFAVRSQVSSPAGAAMQPPPPMGTPASLAGAWLRAFDFEAWDYFASGSDIGWGPWVAETGHGISLITIVLGVRAEETSVWDVLTKEPFSSALRETVLSLTPAFMS